MKRPGIAKRGKSGRNETQIVSVGLLTNRLGCRGIRTKKGSAERNCDVSAAGSRRKAILRLDQVGIAARDRSSAGSDRSILLDVNHDGRCSCRGIGPSWETPTRNRQDVRNAWLSGNASICDLRGTNSAWCMPRKKSTACRENLGRVAAFCDTLLLHRFWIAILRHQRGGFNRFWYHAEFAFEDTKTEFCCSRLSTRCQFIHLIHRLRH